jgi:hypothetical protein
MERKAYRKDGFGKGKTNIGDKVAENADSKIPRRG